MAGAGILTGRRLRDASGRRKAAARMEAAAGGQMERARNAARDGFEPLLLRAAARSTRGMERSRARV